MIDLIFKSLIINNNFQNSLIIGENEDLNYKLAIDLFLKLNNIKNYKKVVFFDRIYQNFFSNNNYNYLIFDQLDINSSKYINEYIIDKEKCLIIFEVKTYVDSKLIEELIKKTNLNFIIISKDSKVFINYSTVKNKINHIFLFNHYDKKMLYSLYAKNYYSFPGFLSTYVSMTLNDNTFVIDNKNKKIYNYKFSKNIEICENVKICENKKITHDNILNITDKFKLEI